MLSPDGSLQGGLNDQVRNAGNCTLLSYGYGDFATLFPSCAVGGGAANTEGTGVSVVGQKWLTRVACVQGEMLLILLPDFGGNGTVDDTCKSFQRGLGMAGNKMADGGVLVDFHSVPGSDPLLFHAQQDIYGELSFIVLIVSYSVLAQISQ